jgi:hypothetical protein
VDELRATVVPLFLAIMEDDEVDGGEELSERTRWSRFQCVALRRLAEEEDKRAEEERLLLKGHSSNGSSSSSSNNSGGGASGSSVNAKNGAAAQSTSSISTGDISTGSNGSTPALSTSVSQAVFGTHSHEKRAHGSAKDGDFSGGDGGSGGGEWLGQGNMLEAPPHPLVWRGARRLRTYGWQDHLQVAGRAALESLAVLPFWACKVCPFDVSIHPSIHPSV